VTVKTAHTVKMKRSFTRYFSVGNKDTIFSSDQSIQSIKECEGNTFKLSHDGEVMIVKTNHMKDDSAWRPLLFFSRHRDPHVDNRTSKRPNTKFFKKTSSSQSSIFVRKRRPRFFKTTTSPSLSSVVVPLSTLEKTYWPTIKQMECRSDHILFLDENGKDLFGMENNKHGQVDPLDEADEIGKCLSEACDSDDSDKSKECSWCAVRINLSPVWKEISRLHSDDKISMVVCGNSHSGIIFQETGIVVMWGLNTFGQLGSKSTQPFIFVDGFSPRYTSKNCIYKMIASMCGETTEPAISKPTYKASQIATGCDNTIVCTSSGDVFVWGQDYFFHTIPTLCNANKYFPLHIDLPYLNKRVKSVCVACDRICFCRTIDGELFIWGNKDMDNKGERIRTPTRIKPELRVSRFSGSSLCCLIAGTKRESPGDSETVHEIHQMKGTTGFIHVPFEFPQGVSRQTEFSIHSISAGKSHSYVLLNEIEFVDDDQPRAVEAETDFSSDTSDDDSFLENIDSAST